MGGCPPGPGQRPSPHVWPAESTPCQPQGMADWCLAVVVLGPGQFGARVRLLEDFPLALPDGDECVATGGP